MVFNISTSFCILVLNSTGMVVKLLDIILNIQFIQFLIVNLVYDYLISILKYLTIMFFCKYTVL